MDVEFDDVEDVPDILNALTIKVNAEKFNKKNDLVRTASLLPKQIREAKARKAALQTAEKSFDNKKVAGETLNFMKEQGAMNEEALKKLEGVLGQKQGAWRKARGAAALVARASW